MTESNGSNARDVRNKRIFDKLRRELGPVICEWLERPDVNEIMLNDDGRVWGVAFGQPKKHIYTMTESHAESVMATLADINKTVVNHEEPLLECGFHFSGRYRRFAGALPPCSLGPQFNIRCPPVEVYPLSDYVKKGIMTQRQYEVICQLIREKKNIVVTGGTFSGKTTLLNAIIAQIAIELPSVRLGILEDTYELQCQVQDNIRLFTTKDISMQTLLKHLLRRFPDGIITGEVRDGACLALCEAWNTGHEGGGATIHSNTVTPQAALMRLESLIEQATNADKRALIGEAVDCLICIEATDKGRRVTSITRVLGFENDNYVLENME
ncbi:P-type conjugative transfer ATPase TrbB [Erwinia amylovora]|uniref:P-type conjugative transfer ATPase TrbB n=1 Tax=Erwinia amylovora TaxID=552 RepID=UPI001443C449|nr:P-type conjugative transfer ATPase TrbB [Erwinia amylovora]